MISWVIILSTSWAQPTNLAKIAPSAYSYNVDKKIRGEFTGILFCVLWQGFTWKLFGRQGDSWAPQQLPKALFARHILKLSNWDGSHFQNPKSEEQLYLGIQLLLFRNRLPSGADDAFHLGLPTAHLIPAPTLHDLGTKPPSDAHRHSSGLSFCKHCIPIRHSFLPLEETISADYGLLAAEIFDENHRTAGRASIP